MQSANLLPIFFSNKKNSERNVKKNKKIKCWNCGVGKEQVKTKSRMKSIFFNFCLSKKRSVHLSRRNVIMFFIGSSKLWVLNSGQICSLRRKKMESTNIYFLVQRMKWTLRHFFSLVLQCLHRELVFSWSSPTNSGGVLLLLFSCQKLCLLLIFHFSPLNFLTC